MTEGSVVMSNKKQLKKRTVYYFRCQYKNHLRIEINDDLEQMVVNSWNKLNTARKRIFIAGNDKSTVGMFLKRNKVRFKEGNFDCTLFTIGIFEAGASANTILQPTEDHDALEADTIDAPEFSEYLDGEAFVCIYKNHIVCSPTSTLRNSTIQNFISSLLSKGGYENESNLIDIHQIANINKINQIKSEGVKTLTINASLFLESFEHKKDKKIQPATFAEKTYEYLSKVTDLFAIDDTDEELNELDHLNTKLVINLDKRKGIDTEALEKAAKDLIQKEDLDGYAIITKEGNRITNDQIVLKSDVYVAPNGKSVKRENVFGELKKAIEKYNKEGVLEI